MDLDSQSLQSGFHPCRPSNCQNPFGYLPTKFSFRFWGQYPPLYTPEGVLSEMDMVLFTAVPQREGAVTLTLPIGGHPLPVLPILLRSCTGPEDMLCVSRTSSALAHCASNVAVPVKPILCCTSRRFEWHGEVLHPLPRSSSAAPKGSANERVPNLPCHDAFWLLYSTQQS